jgi:uncharacterized delta-60 repeat protein
MRVALFRSARLRPTWITGSGVSLASIGVALFGFTPGATARGSRGSADREPKFWTTVALDASEDQPDVPNVVGLVPAGRGGFTVTQMSDQRPTGDLLQINTETGVRVERELPLPPGVRPVRSFAGAAGSALLALRPFGVARIRSDLRLDPKFGRRGVVRVAGLSNAWASALRPGRDGSAVVAGSLVADSGDGTVVALRLARDGELDRSFGQAGVARVTVPGLDSLSVRSVSAWSGGRIGVVGFGYGHASRRSVGFVVVLNRDGHIDGSIGGGSGVLKIGRGRLCPGACAGVGPDSRVFAASNQVVGGQSRLVVSGSTGDFVGDAEDVLRPGAGNRVGTVMLMRLRPDGSVDPGFGQNGLVLADLGGSAGGVSMALNRRSITVGSGVASNFAVVRFTPSGRIAKDFGAGGRACLRPTGDANDAFGQEVAVDRRGDALVGGGFAISDGVDSAVTAGVGVIPARSSVVDCARVQNGRLAMVLGRPARLVLEIDRNMRAGKREVWRKFDERRLGRREAGVAEVDLPSGLRQRLRRYERVRLKLEVTPVDGQRTVIRTVFAIASFEF